MRTVTSTALAVDPALTGRVHARVHLLGAAVRRTTARHSALFDALFAVVLAGSCAVADTIAPQNYRWA